MKLLLSRKPCYMVFLVIIFLSITVISFAQEKSFVATGDMKEIVTILEDPQKREAFVKNLKQMIQIQEAAQKDAARYSNAFEKAKEISFIASGFKRFELISEQVLEAANRTFTGVDKLPELLGSAKSYLGKPENRNAFIIAKF